MSRPSLRAAWLDRRAFLIPAGLLALGAALAPRALDGKTFLYGDVQHFFAFAETLFTARHFDYYASVADQAFTYAHLPLFPMLLAPVQRLFDALELDRILAVKVLVHTFEVGAAGLLIVLARRQGLRPLLALALGALWLYTPWVYEAGAGNGHAPAVAAFFLLAAVLRLGVPWQAGALMALSVLVRSEFVVPALAFAGWYARAARRPGAEDGQTDGQTNGAAARWRWDAGAGLRPLGAYTGAAVAVGAAVLGPYLVRDAGAVHWAVVGHLQDRGDALPVLRGITRTFTGATPDVLRGPQDWAMLAALAAAPVVGLLHRDPRWAAFRAALLYALALTLGHGRYFVLPLTTGLIVAARPRAAAWLIPVYLVEFVLPLAPNPLWVVRAAGALAVFLWPLHRRWPGRRPAPRAA